MTASGDNKGPDGEGELITGLPFSREIGMRDPWGGGLNGSMQHLGLDQETARMLRNPSSHR